MQRLSSRHEETWHQFLSELKKYPRLSLRSYLRSRQIPQKAFEKWMTKHGHSVREAKRRLQCLQTNGAPVGSLPSDGSTLIPVRIAEAESPVSMLSGISLTLPDGTVISIRRGSADAVVSFLKLYFTEGLPCSD